MGRKFWTFLGWPLLVVPQLLLLFGLLLNALVINANRGHMPVNSPVCLEEDGFHICETAETRYRKLDDWIDIGTIGVYSPGDAFIYTGELSKGPFFWGWLSFLIICDLTDRKFYLESKNG